MTRLASMALKRVSVPVLLHHPDDEELPENIDMVWTHFIIYVKPIIVNAN